MKKWIVYLLSFVMLAGCETQDAVHNIKEETKKILVTQMFKPKDVQYVALGDSLTQGVGDEAENEGYVGRLKTDMETWQGVRSVTIHNEAKKGRRSDQLIDQLQSGKLDDTLRKANIITLTIGGNDLMKIVREHITELKKKDFDKGRPKFQQRYETIMQMIRERNPIAPIILIGVYNPLTIFTKEESEMNTIMDEWNSDIRGFADDDPYAVFVNVEDLFDTNANLVYHTDFFHPNARGYDQMTARIIETLEEENLKKLSQGQFDFQEDSIDE